jgi:Ca2+:H+ antiporter
VSALRHQQVQARRVKAGVEDEDHDEHAGHDGPSWSRAVSASVLLACTALYAAIAGTCLLSAFRILASCRVSRC